MDDKDIIDKLRVLIRLYDEDKATRDALVLCDPLFAPHSYIYEIARLNNSMNETTAKIFDAIRTTPETRKQEKTNDDHIRD